MFVGLLLCSHFSVSSFFSSIAASPAKTETGPAFVASAAPSVQTVKARRRSGGLVGAPSLKLTAKASENRKCHFSINFQRFFALRWEGVSGKFQVGKSIRQIIVIIYL